MIQHYETNYKALHHTASHCTTLHHTATHCNTLHKTREFQTQLLHYFSKGDNKSNHHQHTTSYMPMRHDTLSHFLQHSAPSDCTSLHHAAPHYILHMRHETKNFITRERIHVLIPDPPIIFSNYTIGVHTSYAHTSFINTYIMYEHLICTPVRSKGAIHDGCCHFEIHYEKLP